LNTLTIWYNIGVTSEGKVTAVSYTENATISHTLTFRNETVKSGAFLKVSGIYGLVQFECIVHNLDNNKDYLLVHVRGEKRMIPIGRLLSVVQLKRSRRKTK